MEYWLILGAVLASLVLGYLLYAYVFSGKKEGLTSCAATEECMLNESCSAEYCTNDSSDAESAQI